MKHLILVIKKSILALCMLVFALVGGCGTLTPIVEADYAVASGEARQVIGSVSLTNLEEVIINHATNRYMQFTEKWRNCSMSLSLMTPFLAKRITPVVSRSNRWTKIRCG